MSVLSTSKITSSGDDFGYFYAMFFSWFRVLANVGIGLDRKNASNSLQLRRQLLTCRREEMG